MPSLRPFRIRDNAPHRGGQKRRRAVPDHRSRLRVGIVEHNIAICVKHLCIKMRFQILSVIGNGCVCSGQLQVCDAVCQSAQRKRLPDIRECPTVGRLRFNQRCDPELFCIVKPDLRRDLRQTLDRCDVDRTHNRLSDCDVSGIGALRILHRRSVFIVIGLILVNGRQRLAGFIQRRCVDRKDLER